MKRKAFSSATFLGFCLAALVAVSSLAPATPLFAAPLYGVSLSAQSSESDIDALAQAKKLYRSRNFRGAIQELETVIANEPDRADALYLLGYSHLMLRQYSEAVDAFGRAFAADPTFDPRTIYHPTPAEEPMD